MQLALSFTESSFCEFPLPQRLPRPRVKRAPRKTNTAVDIEQLYFDLLAIPDSEVDTYVWTDADIDRVREYMLHHALGVLLDRRNSLASRQEHWAWVMDEEDFGPFSFKTLAYFAGVDSELLREGLVRTFTKHQVLEQLTV